MFVPPGGRIAMVTCWIEIGLALVFWYVIVPRTVSPAATATLSRRSGDEITSPSEAVSDEGAGRSPEEPVASRPPPGAPQPNAMPRSSAEAERIAGRGFMSDSVCEL